MKKAYYVKASAKRVTKKTQVKNAPKNPLRGKYKGRGLMKAFLAGKKIEQEL